MANGRIDENGLPVYAPGDYDYVRVVDRSTGASRNALAPEVTAAARVLAQELGGLVQDARDDIEQIILGLGYLPPVAYAPGLAVDDIKFTVSYNGDVYAPNPDLVPFTTGAWDADQWRVIQGDVNLRSDLADPADGGELVAWRQSGTGARTRDLAAKARDQLHINDFPNSGDGVANDSDALENALNAAVSSGRTLRGEAGRTYRLTRSIDIPVPVGGTLSVDMQGATIYCDDASITIGTAPQLLLTTSFSVDPRKGDPFLALASVAGVQKGDIIYVECPITLGAGNPVMHYYLVEEIDGNDVYIEGVVIEDMTAAQIVADGGSGNWSVQVFRPSERIEFCNARFVVSDPGGTHSVLVIKGAYRAIVDNLDFRGHTRNQLYLQYCGHTLTTRIHCSDFGYIEKNDPYASIPSAPGGQSYGYGIIHARNYSSVVRDVIGARGWHVTDVSRGQMYIKFINVKCLRNTYGLAQHPGCWDVSYVDCEVHGNAGANADSAVYLRFVNCRFIDTTGNGIVYSSAARHVDISGCSFSMIWEGAGAPSVTSAALFQPKGEMAVRKSDGHPAKFVFRGNTVRWFGRLQLGLNSGTIEVCGNSFEFINSCEIRARLSDGSRIDTPSVFIENNTVSHACHLVTSTARVFYMSSASGPANIYFRGNTVWHSADTSFVHAFSADCDGTYVVEGNTTNCRSVVRAASGAREIKHLHNNSGLTYSVAGHNTVIVNCVGNRYVNRLTDDNHVPTVDAGNVQVGA